MHFGLSGALWSLGLWLALGSVAWAEPLPAEEEPGPRLNLPTPTVNEPEASTAPNQAASETASKDKAVAAPRDATAPISTDDPRVLYVLGAHGRLVTVPGWTLGGFLAQHTELTSGSVGLDFTRRKGRFDIILSLDFGFYSLGNGNYLSDSNNAAVDTHYTQFNNLNFLSVDVSFMWQRDLTRWLAFTVGGGIGLGVVLGDVYIINNSQTVCTAANAGNTQECYPVSADTYVDSNGATREIGAIRPGDPDFQRKLDATAESQRRCDPNTSDCRDTSQHPHYHASNKPPVLPVINFQFGFKFKIHRHANINLTAGFRNGFIFGGGPEYVF